MPTTIVCQRRAATLHRVRFPRAEKMQLNVLAKKCRENIKLDLPPLRAKTKYILLLQSTNQKCHFKVNYKKLVILSQMLNTFYDTFFLPKSYLKGYARAFLQLCEMELLHYLCNVQMEIIFCCFTRFFIIFVLVDSFWVA